MAILPTTRRGMMMASVSRKWLKENVEELSGFGGQITLDNLHEYCKVPKGGFDTTLSEQGKAAVEHGDRDKPFLVCIPGAGWADCRPKQSAY